jgi:hypothetical protein
MPENCARSRISILNPPELKSRWISFSSIAAETWRNKLYILITEFLEQYDEELHSVVW